MMGQDTAGEATGGNRKRATNTACTGTAGTNTSGNRTLSKLSNNARTNEEGSTLPLAIFYGALALLVVLLAAAATSLYLERKRLYTLSDGAALAAAEAFPLDQAVWENGRVRVALRNGDVARAVDAYLSDVAATGFETLSVVRAESTDGQTATVTLGALWRPPFLDGMLPSAVRVEVTSEARSVFR